MPIAWFPRLLAASSAERANVTLSAFGLHWETLDEDISVLALMAEHTASRQNEQRRGSEDEVSTEADVGEEDPPVRQGRYPTRGVYLGA